MIPKIIHYCWLSEEPIPTNLQNCINSWNTFCPEFEIIKWDSKRFDINSVSLVSEAVAAQKWAYAADYIRLYALYTMGGLYLDSDVMLYDDISKLFDSNFISAVEYHPKKIDLEQNIGCLDELGNRVGERIKVFSIGIQAAILASVPNHPLVYNCMNFYKKVSLKYLLENNLTAPTVLAYHAEEYGFKYKNTEQRLQESIHLYNTQVFSHFDQYNRHSVAVHYCAGSWRKKTLFRRILVFIKNNKILFSIYLFFKQF